MKREKAVSIAFEGMYGAGKTTVMRKLVDVIHLASERVWIGHGYTYSVIRGEANNTSIPDWTEYRIRMLLELMKHCDVMLLERCVFNDFSNLHFRKHMIDAETLWKINQAWWPNYSIVIVPPLEICMERIEKRGDTFRANLEDLKMMRESLNYAFEFLKPRLRDKLTLVSNPDEAYEIGLRIIQEHNVELWIQ